MMLKKAMECGFVQQTTLKDEIFYSYCILCWFLMRKTGVYSCYPKSNFTIVKIKRLYSPIYILRLYIKDTPVVNRKTGYFD
jgi:hypothetical protein